jgi:PE-PPE domain
MSGRRRRRLGFARVASAGAGLLVLPSMMTPAFACGVTPDVAGDTPVPFEVMGGFGVDQRPDSYITDFQSLYFPSTPLFPGQPTFPDVDAQALFTPEDFYPLGGVTDPPYGLPLVISVSQGVQILNDTIQPYIAAGTLVDAFGYSRTAVIASLEMENLQAAGVPSSAVNFVLVGDLMNPNGGIFERFAGLQLPSLGIDFYGATPSDAFPTTIYTLEYDGWADFPRYPIDLLSDQNAIQSPEHFDYIAVTPAEVATAIPLTTTGATDTTYYMIPVENLPLLDPVRDIPIFGNPIADLLQPDLTYLVNLGYGDPMYGWSTAPANAPTPFGLFPPLSAFEELPPLLVSGAEQGIQNFIGDLTGTGPNPVTLTSLGVLLPSLMDPSSAMSSTLSDPPAALSAVAAAPEAVSNPAASLTDFVNTPSSVASTAYGTLLPTADILDAALTGIPAYDASLFLANLTDPIDAVGLPIAADTALLPLLASFEQAVIEDAVQSMIAALTSLIPF